MYVRDDDLTSTSWVYAQIWSKTEHFGWGLEQLATSRRSFGNNSQESGNWVFFFFFSYLFWIGGSLSRWGLDRKRQNRPSQTCSAVLKTCCRERSFTAGAQGRFLNGKTEEFYLSAPPVWVQKTYMPYLVLYIILLIAESFGNLQEYLCGCLLTIVKVRISFSASFILVNKIFKNGLEQKLNDTQEVKRKSPGYANSKY